MNMWRLIRFMAVKVETIRTGSQNRWHEQPFYQNMSCCNITCILYCSMSAPVVGEGRAWRGRNAGGLFRALRMAASQFQVEALKPALHRPAMIGGKDRL